MRKAAGILLIIFGVAAMILFIVNVSGLIRNPYEHIVGVPPDYVFIIIATLAVFFIVGGILCLRRKCWRLCFTSSLFLHISITELIFSQLFSQLFFFEWMIPLWLSLIPLWIIPLIFVSLRKSEWQEISA
jgi:hypothetical protein